MIEHMFDRVNVAWTGRGGGYVASAVVAPSGMPHAAKLSEEVRAEEAEAVRADAA